MVFATLYKKNWSNENGGIMKRIVLLVAALLLLGCAGVGVTPGKGRLAMLITDAKPSANITSVVVTISEIEVHSIGGNWSVFTTETKSYDLLELQGVTDVLGENELDGGNYTQIRLKVDSVEVTDSGVEYNASVPSEKIKLVHPFSIEEGETTTLVLDFEADKLVVKTGAGEYLVKPASIKVSEEE